MLFYLESIYRVNMFSNSLIDSGLIRELVVLIISALPITELRGALPVAINIFHFPWYYALLLALIGNILPVPLLLLFFNSLSRLLSRVGFLDKAIHWLLERTRQKEATVRRYGSIGLALFVAVPLPLTGAWTASLIAVLLGMDFRHAFLSILAGVVIAGAIVTGLCLLGWVGALIAGVIFASLTIFGLWRF